ncbi:MAG: PIN domain-containing protein [bacterium]|nr:PIN domain-containing protein [bacterium]
MNKLYIDTNTYLSYISPTSEIKSLEKLHRLLETKKVELILPTQTINEFNKHLKKRVQSNKDKTKGKASIIPLPAELLYKKLTREEEILEKKINDINQELKKVKEKRNLELIKHLDEVETLLKKIFKLAVKCGHTDEIILRAVIRYTKGLPPRKNDDKYGDAIIWETLKDYVKTDDLIIVTLDPDFSEKNKNKNSSIRINKILQAEWKKHTNKKLNLFPFLGQCLNTIEKEHPVSKESIQKEAAQSTNLSFSPIFNVNSQFQVPDINSIYAIPNSRIDLTAVPKYDDNAAVNPLNSIVDRTSNFTQSLQNFSAVDNGLYIKSANESIANSGSVRANSFCTRCGKQYTPSNVGASFSSLCENCSKYYGLGFAR